MKIGILSMHRIVNYGSFLQAYALKRVIENMGYECVFVDIKQGDSLYSKSQMIKSKFKIITQRNIKQLFGQKRQLAKFSRLYKEFTYPILGITDKIITDEKCDIVVIGSDEVFNCIQPSPWGFSTQLLGEGINAEKVISYAASFGHTTIDKIKKYGVTERVSNSLKNLSAISVRDKNSFDIIEILTKSKPGLSLDPTLLYNFESEIANAIPDKNYIIIYAYVGRFKDKKDIEEVKEFARKHNKRTIAVGYYQYWCDENIVVTPYQYLRYMKDAYCIITDTFHGTIFSIKFNKNFCTLVRDTNKQKLGFLLRDLQLENRIVSSSSEISRKLNEPIDYDKVNKLLEMKKRDSIEYLSKNLVI